MPVNYELAKIYEIVNSENDITYIGSTAQKLLSSRMGGHRSDARRHSTPFYEAMNKIGIEKFHIRLIKPFPCASKAELQAEEYRIIDAKLQAGCILYNQMTAGNAHSEATKQKMRIRYTPELRQKYSESRTGEKNKTFKYGCIKLSKPKVASPSWYFSCGDTKERYSKGFSCRIYGFWGAYNRAQAERKAYFPQWKTDEEVTLEEFMNLDY